MGGGQHVRGASGGWKGREGLCPWHGEQSPRPKTALIPGLRLTAPVQGFWKETQMGLGWWGRAQEGGGWAP